MSEPKGAAGARQKRDYDTRAHRLRALVTELLRIGIVPRVIEVDGLHVEVAAYNPPEQQRPRASNPGVLGQEDERRTHSAAAPRSYRRQAAEELRRRIKESDS